LERRGLRTLYGLYVGGKSGRSTPRKTQEDTKKKKGKPIRGNCTEGNSLSRTKKSGHKGSILLIERGVQEGSRGGTSIALGIWTVLFFVKF